MSENGWAMERIRDAIKRAAPSRIAIVIRGEPGVGKGFLARTIHKLSGRTGDFVILNCEGVSADQIETDLFGCENGNFIGVTDTKVGAIEAARCGTVFLEEIGEMPPHLQARLLRAVEDREVVPVGATRPRRVDARFISSTSQDLDAASSDGRFRADLFFRLNGVTLEIPPLRERTDEISKLVDTFINDFGRDSDRQPNIAGHARHRRVFIKGFRRESDRQQSLRMLPDAMDILLRYPWPGNIGELKKVIGRARLLCDGSEISPNHLTVEMRAAFEGLAGQMNVDAKPKEETPQNAARSPEFDGERVSPLQSPEAMAERERILEALERTTSRMRRRGSS